MITTVYVRLVDAVYNSEGADFFGTFPVQVRLEEPNYPCLTIKVDLTNYILTDIRVDLNGNYIAHIFPRTSESPAPSVRRLDPEM